ncbi:hypothetical protein C7Y71_000060 [Pseudoprevotella muciniphila]|uniref:Uncharacterized protein n=1 Tax=Pseudoprevotella muciniphila TaxID=2133944 RepID=A0A5P8E3Q5_9BACT|nr:hypothetical protein [Pseudoprevotella muciniphila]QFQ11554.1 hypothetical protein C7Y71_000060 [Pseudoprevotella muciniphila]
MKTNIKKVQLLAPRWWNPLFWLFVVLAPVLGIIAGSVFGGFMGLLIGYESGLEASFEKMRQINAKLP